MFTVIIFGYHAHQNMVLILFHQLIVYTTFYTRETKLSAITSSIIGGLIFIYSCSAQIISFEINCFYGL